MKLSLLIDKSASVYKQKLYNLYKQTLLEHRRHLSAVVVIGPVLSEILTFWVEIFEASKYPYFAKFNSQSQLMLSVKINSIKYL